MKQLTQSDLSLLNRYNDRCPRYTSYPTALEFTETFSNTDLVVAARQSTHTELSLYIHIPFCHSLCYYCGCNKIVTRHQDKADEYLETLFKEIESRGQIFTNRQVVQLHLGGGTPSFLTESQISRLINKLKCTFSFDAKAEMSIEIDPRKIDLSYLDTLHQLGFNRLSIGVQDTNENVQTAINRVQCTEFIAQLVGKAHNLGFNSVNLDLIYGLPHQTEKGFRQTLFNVLAMAPERISLFSYAHLPQRFAAQRKIKDEWLPTSDQKLDLMQLAVSTLLHNGYVMIGMDHFAKPTDELAIAQKEGLLTRNFQGYTINQKCDLLGLGVSSISQVGNTYSQNCKDLKQYHQSIKQFGHGIEKGCQLNRDDEIRGYVIQQLMCNLLLDKSLFEHQFGLNFDEYFSNELPDLTRFISDGLLSNTDQLILVSSKATLIIRHICKVFDAYQHNSKNQMRYSRVI